ncbi:DUF3426 domain-containing protein [Ferribacterium limneticum]|uniref:DUF3426 domain-containing protein n=1 Tax=Ferribacterium limneticum TaxID=76259 RepID=UPI001CFA9240|nr:DUF3426 domain-containing protein [Ferribacterium limneticum]
MRTRCPACTTVFRVTSEQLRLRAGKVRCGNCQAVFNAFDELVSEAHEPLIETPVAEVAVPQDEPAFPESDTSFEAQEIEAPEIEPDIEPDIEPEAAVDDWAGDLPPETVEEPFVEPPITDQFEQPVDAAPEDIPPVDAEQSEALLAVEAEPIQAPLEEPLVESPEESTQAARQAGLVAARELIDSGSFNRWSAGTLASDGLGGFESESNHRAVWPFVLVAILLLVGLLGQLVYYFRTDIVLRFPGVVGLYELAAVDIPLPRNAALVSIETSDLQSDNARGLFVLQATLKNRAGYAQAWPALELSLTDTNDAVVSRRVMFAADYLPPGTISDTFPANGEMAVKLWIEAKESGASGYRLYIFYP